MTSDEVVAQAIRTVFAKFDEFGTVKQVCGWWEEQGLKFPVRRIVAADRVDGSGLPDALVRACTCYIIRPTRAPTCSDGPRRCEAAQLAVEQLQHEQQQAERMWQLQLEKAEYEAQRAERQYNSVEPENRLVARNLEARWNAALSQVEQLKTQALCHRQQIRPLSEHEQARARRLATDLQAVWQAETTTNQDRKQLLRAAISEVQLDVE